MRPYKRWIIITGAFILLNFFLLGLFNFIVDPYQFYRKAQYEPYFIENPYYQNPGLARSYDYDTVIIGNSYSENFVPSFVNRTLGLKTIKLTAGGSSIREQHLILKVALETGKAKNVIWGLDILSLRDGLVSYFPEYLYDKDPFNDYYYLLNYDATKNSCKIVADYFGLLKINHMDIDILGNWNSNFKFGKDIVLSPYKKANKSKRASRLNKKGSNSFYEDAMKNLDEYVISLIDQYKTATFHIVYPPHSILFFRKDLYENDEEAFKDYLAMKRYIIEKLRDRRNVKIYDFQDVKEITFNLDNYKDSAHYHQRINEYVIESISKNRHLVTVHNIEEHLENLRRQVAGFRFEDLLSSR